MSLEDDRKDKGRWMHEKIRGEVGGGGGVRKTKREEARRRVGRQGMNFQKEPSRAMVSKHSFHTAQTMERRLERVNMYAKCHPICKRHTNPNSKANTSIYVSH